MTSLNYIQTRGAHITLLLQYISEANIVLFKDNHVSLNVDFLNVCDKQKDDVLIYGLRKFSYFLS